MARIEVIAQNFDIFEGDGLDRFARTGDISLKHIQKAGASGVILGHSEVKEAPETVNKKLLYAVKQNFFCNNIVLIGESWDEFRNNTPEKVAELMKAKCKIIFKGITEKDMPQIIVGYEPKWGSRGSGRDDMPPPEPKFISSCIAKMREFIDENYRSIQAFYIYGGRSTPERSREILADKNIDGLILGSACNTIEKTMEIANTMKDICRGSIKILVCNFKTYDLRETYNEYVSRLKKLPEDFIIYLAPPYTDIAAVSALLPEVRKEI